MARTIAQIQQAIITAKAANPTLSGLSSTSNVAIWLLWTYVVAVCQWVLESLFDAHVAEVQGIIATMKPHTLQWYVTMARAFQYGYALPSGSDVYVPVAPVGDASLIVANAAAVDLGNLVRIKAAVSTGGVLAALSGPQLTSFAAYMGLVKDAGVRIECTSGAPDNLQLGLKVYYDALVINAAGQRIDGSENTPVMDAINGFLDALPFNGLFVVNKMIAAVLAVPGVVNCEVVVAQANYAMTPYVGVPVEYTPDAGYMALDSVYFGANVVYVAHGPI
jgi:hypothetical protein